MSAGWVAGNVRARTLLSRRTGAGWARAVAAMGSLGEAQRVLADSPYGRGVVVGQPLAHTEHAVAAAPLWHLRVLAGWQPRAGAHALRSLAAGFEAANIVTHARLLAGTADERTGEPSFELGALTTAWSRLRAASSLPELRRALSESPWGDPGGDTPSDIAVGVQVSWAVRVATTVSEASSWAAGALALLVARRQLQELRPLPDVVAVRAARILGPDAMAGVDLSSFGAMVPTRARWALAGVTDVGELWRGEAGWWNRLERDGLLLLGESGFGRARSIGAVAVLAADAWRCRAAVRLAARGGGPMEAYDSVA